MWGRFYQATETNCCSSSPFLCLIEFSTPDFCFYRIASSSLPMQSPHDSWHPWSKLSHHTSPRKSAGVHGLRTGLWLEGYLSFSPSAVVRHLNKINLMKKELILDHSPTRQGIQGRADSSLPAPFFLSCPHLHAWQRSSPPPSLLS